MVTNNGRKFFFGKYKGKFIKDIIVSDTQYITWTMKNVTWFWYNKEEVDLYKQQFKNHKPKTQYEIVMEDIERDEKQRNDRKSQGETY